MFKFVKLFFYFLTMQSGLTEPGKLDIMLKIIPRGEKI
jgi:hypothetical protein